ncbi:MAG: RDD family protein [Flavobacteriaceae bacterium]|nr:RDD family protein [Flavobacteriaceae bacterium]
MNELNQSTKIKTEANIGDRIVAGIVDYIIILTFSIFYVTSFGLQNSEGVYSVSGLPALIPFLFWGIMTIGFEQWFGATLGNLLVGLKAISILGNEKKLTFGQSIKRHLLDPIDMSFLGLVGIVTIKNSKQHQRVGDIWANTIVVKKSELNKTHGNTVYN